MYKDVFLQISSFPGLFATTISVGTSHPSHYCHKPRPSHSLQASDPAQNTHNKEWGLKKKKRRKEKIGCVCHYSITDFFVANVTVFTCFTS